MIKPITDYKQWAETYQISTRSVNCPQCKASLSFNKPIAMKGYRGLKTSACVECGHESGIFRVVPIDPDKIKIWSNLK